MIIFKLEEDKEMQNSVKCELFYRKDRKSDKNYDFINLCFYINFFVVR